MTDKVAPEGVPEPPPPLRTFWMQTMDGEWVDAYRASDVEALLPRVTARHELVAIQSARITELEATLATLTRERDSARNDVDILQRLYDSVRETEDVLFGIKDRPVGDPKTIARWLIEQRSKFEAGQAAGAGDLDCICAKGEIAVMGTPDPLCPAKVHLGQGGGVSPHTEQDLANFGGKPRGGVYSQADPESAFVFTAADIARLRFDLDYWLTFQNVPNAVLLQILPDDVKVEIQQAGRAGGLSPDTKK